MPTYASAPMSFDGLLTLYADRFKHLPLLLNIKADGLQKQISALLEKYDVDNYYLFDMSVPDLLVSINGGLKCLTRQSEFEMAPSLYESVDGVWIDEFKGEWLQKEHLLRHIDQNKKIFIVSPELHGRNHLTRWKFLREMGRDLTQHCVLCTDIPEDADIFYNDEA
jgi:hypothetical protein